VSSGSQVLVGTGYKVQGVSAKKEPQLRAVFCKMRGIRSQLIQIPHFRSNGTRDSFQVCIGSQFALDTFSASIAGRAAEKKDKSSS
jgi:hypothetical protein